MRADGGAAAETGRKMGRAAAAGMPGLAFARRDTGTAQPSRPASAVARGRSVEGRWAAMRGPWPDEPPRRRQPARRRPCVRDHRILGSRSTKPACSGPGWAGLSQGCNTASKGRGTRLRNRWPLAVLSPATNHYLAAARVLFPIFFCSPCQPQPVGGGPRGGAVPWRPQSGGLGAPAHPGLHRPVRPRLCL